METETTEGKKLALPGHCSKCGLAGNEHATGHCPPPPGHRRGTVAFEKARKRARNRRKGNAHEMLVQRGQPVAGVHKRAASSKAKK